MLTKLINLTTRKSLTRLSKTLVMPNNFCSVRCYSKKLNTPLYSSQFNCLSKPISTNPLISLQLTKIISNSLIQKRFSSADHTNVWKLERIIAAIFLPLFPLAMMFDNQVYDSIMAVLIVMHQHWGLEAFIIDYARPIVVGKIVPKLLYISLYLSSILTLAGLLVLTYHGPGFTKVLKQGWAIGKENFTYSDERHSTQPRNQIPREQGKLRKPASALFGAKMKRMRPYFRRRRD